MAFCGTNVETRPTQWYYVDTIDTIDRPPSRKRRASNMTTRPTFAALFYLGLLVPACGYAQVNPTPDEIAARLFLGQAYPSGNVYLKPFPLNTESQSEHDYLRSHSWPDSILFRALSSEDIYAKRIRKAVFSSVMRDSMREIGQNLQQLQSAYIPSLESMDDSHEGCTPAFYRPRNRDYRYLGEDFFSQCLFNCNPNEGTGIYKYTDHSDLSFSVFAYTSDLNLSDIILVNGIRRPMTPEELAEVESQKAKDKISESEWTTVPKYLDSATCCLSADVTGSNLSIRISQYETAGRAGHLARVFILDVIKSGSLLKRYELIHYKGNI